MNKRQSALRRSDHERLFLGSHLTDDALLLSLDGELPAKAAADVDTHVQYCWSCRARRQAIGQSIADLVDYQNAVTAPYLPPPPDQRDVFLARLGAIAADMEQPPQLKQWFNGIFKLFNPAQRIQFGWIAGSLVLIASISAFYNLRTPVVVSANELLNLTSASEVRSLKTESEPVIVQKVRISVGTKSLTRTVYRDVIHHRTTSRTEKGGVAAGLVKAAYLKSSLDWNSLLDAETYRRWRANRPAGIDRVVRQGNDQLTLETTSSEGPVTEADLTVRVADYHVIKERFHFQDQGVVEIAELSYDVIPFASVPEAIFGVPAPLMATRILVAPKLRPVLSSRAELADAEVEAEAKLHELGADLGEQINIKPQVQGHVLIDGVVGDEARKQQLLASLETLPHTRVHLLTVDEAEQQSPPSTAVGDVHPVAPSVQVMVAAPPLLDSQLIRRFPDKDQRIAYVNQTLSLAQLASARAWALNRLADRHPPQEVAMLDVATRRQLQVLLSDHVSALREDISSLQNQAAEILSGSSNTPAANTSVKSPLESTLIDAPASSEDWRERVHRIHSSTEAVHEAIVALFSSSQPSDQNNANAIEINLRTSLTQLQMELQTLDQTVHETDFM